MVAGPVVNDHCVPATVDHYTAGDLEHFGLQGLYARSCMKLGVKPVEAVTRQLPNVVADHHHVTTFDFRREYLGWRRCAALVPVIEACPRLTSLNLGNIGMNAAVARSLIDVLGRHPGIKEVHLDDNALGAAVGELLLKLVVQHRRLHTLTFERCLIVDLTGRKIRKHLAANHEVMDSFSVPLIPDRVTEEDRIRARLREEEERERQARAEAERQRRAEELPAWGPAALADVALTLHKHRHHMPHVFAVFESHGVGGAYVTPRNFGRGMKILDVSTLAKADEAKLCEFADMLGAWDRKENMIHFRNVIAALRTHASILDKAAPGGARPVPAGLCRVADTALDAAEPLEKSFELLDIDQTRCVSSQEAVVGLAAITHSNTTKAEQLIRAVLALDDEAAELPASLNYTTLIGAVGVAPDHEKAPPCENWCLPRSDVLSIAQAS